MSTVPSPANIVASIGPASTVVVGANLTRMGLFVFNPSGVVIWVCPSTTNTGQAQAAVVGGAGSIPIQPQQGLMLGGSAMPPFTNGLNAISASGTNPLTVWEFYA